MTAVMEGPNLTDRTRATVEDAEWMAKSGATTDEASRRLGLARNTLHKNLRRAGRTDIAEMLEANRPGYDEYFRIRKGHPKWGAGRA